MVKQDYNMNPLYSKYNVIHASQIIIQNKQTFYFVFFVLSIYHNNVSLSVGASISGFSLKKFLSQYKIGFDRLRGFLSKYADDCY